MREPSPEPVPGYPPELAGCAAVAVFAGRPALASLQADLPAVPRVVRSHSLARSRRRPARRDGPPLRARAFGEECGEARSMPPRKASAAVVAAASFAGDVLRLVKALRRDVEQRQRAGSEPQREQFPFLERELGAAARG